jgi:hypothetical protein
MGRRYLGGSGEPLTVWISVSVNSEAQVLGLLLTLVVGSAASTVLVFYGYDQGVFGNVIINR